MYFGNIMSNPWMIALIVILIFENIQNYLNNPTALLALVLSIPGILIGITFHEYAHAFVADKLGDDTPRRQGRLTLNPLKHMDPYGMILLLFAGFGWGKPVQINSNNFKRTISTRKGNALVALAGPVMNLIIALVSTVILGLLLKTGTFIVSEPGQIIYIIVEYIIFINIGLAVFNLIPLPPLDGSKILMSILPSGARVWYEEHERILYIIFLILWLTPITSMIISPAIDFLGEKLLKLAFLIAF